MSLATRLVIGLFSAVFSVLMGAMSLTRYASFHNRTYDLAIYARQAWGLLHGDYFDPIVGAHFLGTHVAVVLWPLGLLGRWFGTVPVLLTAQALAFGLATLPLSQFGARRFGDAGALCAAGAFLLYPNISHVASYEFHPGSLGVLPLALAIDALDRQRRTGFVLACLALLACRADFALLTMLLAAAALWPRAAPRMRASAYAVAAVSVAYLGVQYFVLRPRFWALQTSLDLHFARWGGGPTGFFVALVRDPALVWHHLSETKRLTYLPRVLLPLAGLPLLAPRWFLLTAPFLAMNLISTFPTTVELYSHYLTLAVPSLVAAAFAGLAWLSQRACWPVRYAKRSGGPTEHAPSELAHVPSTIEPERASRLGLVAIVVLSLAANVYSGGLPWSRAYDRSAFCFDDVSRQAARIVAAIPVTASVQAPDPLLPHLAERPRLYRAPPPETDADYVVLDISHRRRYAHSEDLLRTIEEPLVRRYLARRDLGLVAAEPTLLLFARGRDPRGGPARHYLSAQGVASGGVALTRCLSVAAAWLDPQGLELELVAHAPCPADLALRLGSDDPPARVDLLFDGLLSPAQLRDEMVLSWHPLRPRERARIVQRGLRLGVLRADGSPPEQGDPISVRVPLIH